MKPKGPDPKNGQGACVDPVTGEQRVLVHGDHAHVNDSAGNRLDINGNRVPPNSPEAHLPIKQPWKKDLLHDWILVRVTFDWKPGRVTLEFEDSAFTRQILIAEGVRELRVPKMNDWGPSTSVNETSEIDAPSGGGRCLNIEMQSGDVILIVAEQIVLRAA